MTTQMQHEVEVSFEDMTVLTEGDTSVFLLNWSVGENPPPYYVVVDGRSFAFTGATLLVKGHGALIGDVVREHEAEGWLTLLLERDGRYLIYTHDPNAEAEDDAE